MLTQQYPFYLTSTLENVDKIKYGYYSFYMTFKVEKLLAAEAEISVLEQSQQDLLKSEYVYVKDSEGYVFS